MRSRVVVAFGAAIVVACLASVFSTSESLAQGHVSVAQASARIKRHMAHIEERRDKMRQAFYYDGAVKTLKASFQEHGVTTSMSVADSWGEMGVGLTWSESAKQFYEYHDGVLNDSLGVIEGRGYATQEEMAYLDAGMKAWDAYDTKLEQQFRALVDAFTDEANVMDEKEAYYKSYDSQLHSLEGQQPRPRARIDALNADWNEKKDAFDKRINDIGTEGVGKAKDQIKSVGGKQLFAKLKKVPGTLPAVATPPDAGPGEVAGTDKSSPKNNAPDENDGLAKPSLPDIVRAKCEANNPEGMKQYDAAMKSASDLRDQTKTLQDAGVKARSAAAEYNRLSEQAYASALRLEKAGELRKAGEDRQRGAKYKQDAKAKEDEAALGFAKATEKENAAKAQEAKARQILADCLK